MEKQKVDFNNLTDEQKEYLKNYKASDSFFLEKSYYIGAGCLYNYDIILAVSILNDMITNAKDTRKISNFEIWLKTVLDQIETDVEEGTVMSDDAEALTSFLTELTQHIGRCVGLAGIAEIKSPQVQYELSDILRQLCERYNLTDNYSLLLDRPLPELFKTIKGTPYGFSYFGKVFASFVEHVKEFKNEPKVVYKSKLEKVIVTNILGVKEENVCDYEKLKTIIKEGMLAPLSSTEKTIVYVADNTIYKDVLEYAESIMKEHPELKNRIVQNVLIRTMTSVYGESQSILWDALDPEGMKKLKAEIDEFAGAAPDSEVTK